MKYRLPRKTKKLMGANRWTPAWGRRWRRFQRGWAVCINCRRLYPANYGNGAACSDECYDPSIWEGLDE